eukprot:3005262-Amphidinium_carterae.1
MSCPSSITPPHSGACTSKAQVPGSCQLTASSTHSSQTRHRITLKCLQTVPAKPKPGQNRQPLSLNGTQTFSGRCAGQAPALALKDPDESTTQDQTENRKTKASPRARTTQVIRTRANPFSKVAFKIF